MRGKGRKKLVRESGEGKEGQHNSNNTTQKTAKKKESEMLGVALGCLQPTTGGGLRGRGGKHIHIWLIAGRTLGSVEVSPSG